MDELNVKDIIPASAERVYTDWLSSEGHTLMTGGEAEASDLINDEFSAWDGYISGKNVALVPHKSIHQLWRTVEFPSDADDSDLFIELEPINESSCKITITQKHLPAGDSKKYSDGWRDHYFEPMKIYYKNL